MRTPKEMAQQYWRRARRSREIAQGVMAEPLRKLLFEIADDWDALAETCLERAAQPGAILAVDNERPPRVGGLIGREH
jgi:hypothetical protein